MNKIYCSLDWRSFQSSNKALLLVLLEPNSLVLAHKLELCRRKPTGKALARLKASSSTTSSLGRELAAMAMDKCSCELVLQLGQVRRKVLPSRWVANRVLERAGCMQEAIHKALVQLADIPLELDGKRDTFVLLESRKRKQLHLELALTRLLRIQ